MSRPPDIEISGGAPTPEEERAVRAAIIALWRDDQIKAARAQTQREGWREVGRAEAAGGHSRGSWRRSTGFMQPGLLLARRVGRGDTR